jgi:hypothetical protein
LHVELCTDVFRGMDFRPQKAFAQTRLDEHIVTVVDRWPRGETRVDPSRAPLSAVRPAARLAAVAQIRMDRS